MQKNILVWIICAVLITLSFFGREEVYAANVSAKAAVVIENSTGKILYEKNARQRLPMASTTKIMTAICAIENSHPSRLITVADEAVGIEGSSIYLVRNEQITVRDLLYGMMLSSGNDAATALAIEVSGSVEKFAELMTETARKIGAQNTNFVNACGLYEDDHYTTAYDLALITAYALKNPLFAEIVSTYETKISGSAEGTNRYLKNHNKLLKLYDGCIGVKTGYTKKCGRCLVTSARRDGVTLTCVTLNAPDDWNDHMSLLSEGFSRTMEHTVAGQNSYCCRIQVPGSVQGSCSVAFKDTLSFVSIDGDCSDATIEYEWKDDIKAPLLPGQSIGTARLCIDGTAVATSELVCTEPVVPIPPKTFGDILMENLQKMFGL